jgi:hypothetical protein
MDEIVPDLLGFPVFRAEDPLDHREQRRELVAGPGRIPRPPGEAGEVAAGGQGGRVLGGQHPLADGQQRGEQVAGPAASPASPAQRARSRLTRRAAYAA